MHQDASWSVGRPQPRGLCVKWGPNPPLQKGAEPPIFGACLLRPNGCMDQDAAWYRYRPRPRRHCVRWGPSSPFPKKGAEPPPHFLAHVYCDQTAGWIKMALGMEVGLDSGHIVLDGTQLTSPKRGQSPQFSAHFCCGQTAGCIKMPLSMEVGLSPGNFLLDGDPARLPKKGASPNFQPTYIVAKRLHGSRCHLVQR